MFGYDSLTKAERFLAHDIDKIISLLERIIPAPTLLSFGGVFGRKNFPMKIALNVKIQMDILLYKCPKDNLYSNTK